jgi:hypothetical protein
MLTLSLGHLVPGDVFWDVLCCGMFCAVGTFSVWDVLSVGHIESGTF